MGGGWRGKEEGADGRKEIEESKVAGEVTPG